MRIIVLGSDCSITFHLIENNLKGPSSLFEWCIVPRFSDIHIVLEELIKKNSIDIFEKDSLPGNLFLGNSSIYTSHYSKETYPEIVKRRWERFVSYVQTEKVLFVYDDKNGYTSQTDIQYFKLLIEKLNPQAKYNILLLSKEDGFTQIIEEKLFHCKFKKEHILGTIEGACSFGPPYKFCSDRDDKD